MTSRDFDPYSGYDGEEADLEEAVADYFDAASSSVPPSKVRAAIKSGSPTPILSSLQWKLSGARLRANVEKVELGLIRGGMASGVAEIPSGAPRLGPRIAELAEQHAGVRAVEMAQAIDGATGAGLRKMIGRASREYARSQSLATLRRLEAEIRSSIGVTPKQGARILAWRSAAEKAGLDPAAISEGVARRAEAAKALRARMIADRGVVESVSFARHQSWVEARDAGDIPKNVKKQWRDQGDKSVRASHRAQSRQGPIPLDDPYPIQGVMHPPSDDPNCRCWETLVIGA